METNQEETEEKPIGELPGDEKEDVLFDTIFGVRTIDLNRPRKLHALSGSMIRKVIPRLQEWAKSDMANVIIMRGTGPSKPGAPKAFCAGGDVASLALDNKLGEEGQQRSQDYFGLEYKLDHLIATYPKPFIAYMDGITMGGGVGLSIHAPFRIATENTVFAMPETKIGFFPDVGASFFLPRMPGGVGTYLALTSERLTGANVFYSGIATHYIHSTTMPALQRRLAEIKFNDWDPLEERLQHVNDTIEEYCTGLPHDQPMLLSGRLRKAIDRCFTKNTIEEILRALEAEDEDDFTKAWAERTIRTLNERSPTAVHVTLRQMRLGAKWSLAETFQREHQMAGKFMRHPDFVEGVHAVLIERTNTPKWKPATLEDIKPEDSNAIVDPFFEVEGEDRLKLLNDDDFRDYRWARFSIPRESDVQRAWMKGGQSKNAVANKFIDARLGKQGISEVVREMLSRKAKKDDQGNPIWE